MFTTYVRHSARPAVSLQLDNTKLNQLATSSKLIVRKSRKFSALGFLHTLLAAVCDGRGSFSALSARLQNFEQEPMSREGMWQRCNDKALKFLQSVLAELGANILQCPGGRFERVLLEDATQLRIHPANAQHYKGLRNQSGWTSTVKLDAIVDLNSGDMLAPHLAEGKSSDKRNGRRLFDHLREGDLVLRDMGYFDVDDLERIGERRAYFVSRLHPNAQIKLNDGRDLDHVLANTGEDVIDQSVEVTAKSRRMRLVALRVPPEIAEQRRRKTRAHSKRMGCTTRKRTLVRCDWSLYLTNIEADDCSAPEIARLYEARWAVEIRFRAIKGNTKTRELLNRRTSKIALDILLHALLIHAHLSARVFSILRRSKQCEGLHLSVEMLTRWLSIQLLDPTCMLHPRPCDLRQITMDRRKRKSLETRVKPLT